MSLLVELSGATQRRESRRNWKVTLINANNMKVTRYNGDCRNDKNPCHLQEAPGPCRGLVTRYFFDSKSQQCKQFFYGGCFGNANNFRSMAECQAKCQSPAKPTVAPEIHTQSAGRVDALQPIIITESKPKGVCFSPVDTGTCDGAEKRFAYNPKTKRCQVFHYSGCGGNENNFTFRKHCIKKCIRGRKVQTALA
ncbi:hypothetical protein F2P81_020881 [Scophthalmus maximus]|uniref:BPTI/Kunitz inhibitor domain-containing protein n=1 Tax=Scophthalmus maximus TaxID=52904 RepID=A0A6A4S6F3_SCOMX|nr:hypothetical protein F2P81_020881 [Scophthalmus maximus]